MCYLKRIWLNDLITPLGINCTYLLILVLNQVVAFCQCSNYWYSLIRLTIGFGIDGDEMNGLFPGDKFEPLTNLDRSV